MIRVPVLLSCVLTLALTSPVPPSSLGGSVSSSTSQGSGAPGRDVVTWNQSQHGKYNLQLSLKDVKIVAVINSDYYDDEDEDYDYDYAELVANKPENKPEEVDVEDVDEEEQAVSLGNSTVQVTEAPGNDTKPDGKDHDRLPAVLLTFVADGKPENISQLPTDPEFTTKRPHPVKLYHRQAPTSTTTAAPVECKPDHVKDRLGRCRPINYRKRRPSFFPFKFNFPGFRLARRRFLRRQLAPQGRGLQYID